MKIKLLTFVIMLCTICQAQPIMKDGAGIDTITIVGYMSAYFFAKDNGGYRRIDTFQIAYDISRNSYMTSLFASHKSRDSEMKARKWERLNRHELMIGSDILRYMLDSLMQSFTVKAIQPTADQVGISERDLKTYLNEERIRREVKQHSWPGYWKHHKKILTRQRSPAFFDAFTNLDTFRSYLAAVKIDTAYGHHITSDYADGIQIFISAGSYRYHYYSEAQKFKQPWHDEPLNAPMPGREYTYFYTRTPIFNYSINKYLLAILPVDFVQISQMRNEDLIENYLAWFIHHQGFLTQMN